MAYKIIRKNGEKPPFAIPTGDAEKGNTEIVAICDTAADITSLGTKWRAGSIAIIPGGDVKFLNASETWA